jgi:hypothetical protein
MKKNVNSTDNLLAQFDKELQALLTYDLKQFKANQGKFLRNNPGNTRDRNQMVA